jgi:hypothetical protein
MCGRYTLTNPKEIPKRFETSNELPLFDAPFNIPPATRNPIGGFGITPQKGKISVSQKRLF